MFFIMADSHVSSNRNPAKMSGKRDKSKEERKRKEDKVKDEKLDFYSEKFDPLLALKCKSLIPPVPKPKVFDNLAMYDSHLKRTQKDGADQSEKETKEEKPGSSKEQVVKFERRFEPHQMPVKTTKIRKELSNVFLLMEPQQKSAGMMAVLSQAKKQNLQITVTIRHSHGIRGVCIANLSMFDKYWNMTLSNVKEYWIRKKTGLKVPVTGSATKEEKYEKFFPRVQILDVNKVSKCQATPHTVDYELQKLVKMLQSNMYGRNKKNSELCYRRANELLVRGEQVVFIAIAQGRQS